MFVNAELWPPGHLQMTATIMGGDDEEIDEDTDNLVIAVRRIVLVAPTHVTLIEGGVLVTTHGLVS